MSRPKKQKIDFRTINGEGKPGVPHNVHLLYVDPFMREPLALVFGLVISGENPSLAVRKFCGNELIKVLDKGTADELEDIFRRVLALKREWEKPINERPVHVRVLLFYSDFVHHYGFEPTWKRFRKALLDESDIHDLPEKEDGKGWDRLKKNAYLTGMPKK